MKWNDPEKGTFLAALPGAAIISAGVFCISQAIRFQPPSLATWIGFFFVAVAWLFFVLYKFPDPKNSNEFNEFREQTNQGILIIANLFVGLAFGLCLSYSSGLLNTLSSSNISVALALGVVFFSVQLIADATKTNKELHKILRDSINKMKDAVQQQEDANTKADGIMSAARFADVAVRALEIKTDKISNKSCSRGISASLNNMRAWIDFGLSRSGSPSDNNHFALDHSCWGFMETYFREERYDICRGEIVTNVRNYAFILLRIIWEFLEAEIKSGNNRRKVVVGQVTPFPPKDFYNFPNGSESRRFYHDAEFYGTYRRGMSYLVKHPKIEVRRVILCCGESDKNASFGEELGWAIDSIAQIAVSSKYTRVLPTSVPVRADDTGKKTSSNDVESYQISHIRVVGDRNKHDPATRLKKTGHLTKYSYSWVPVHVDGRWHTPAKTSLGSEFDQSSLKSRFDSDQKFHWSINEADQGEYNKRFIDLSSEQSGEFWKQLQKIISGAEPQPLKGDPETHLVDQIKKKFGSLEKIKNRVEKESQIDVNKISGIVDVFKQAQELDELLATWKPELILTSSVGLPMGYAEGWLYWWLATLESQEWNKNRDEAVSSLPTVWDRFCEDILGVTKNKTDLNSILPFFRVAKISNGDSHDPSQTTSIKDLEQAGISPEFFLIGYCNNEGGDPEWLMSLSANLSEPFHSTRLTLGHKEGESFKAHEKYFREFWEKSEEQTKQFLEVLNHEDFPIHRLMKDSSEQIKTGNT